MVTGKKLSDQVRKDEPTPKPCIGSDDTIGIHQKVLDDIVNVNSLFSVAVFVGLSWTNPELHSLKKSRDCDPDPILAKTLVVFEVLSFACFLLSSVVAKALKVVLNLLTGISVKSVFDDHFRRYLLSHHWRRFLLATSILASFTGILFLTLSIVQVIQLKIGTVACGSVYAFRSIVAVSTLVSFSLLLYIPSMVYAVFATSANVDLATGANVGHPKTS